MATPEVPRLRRDAPQAPVRCCFDISTSNRRGKRGVRVSRPHDTGYISLVRRTSLAGRNVWGSPMGTTPAKDSQKFQRIRQSNVTAIGIAKEFTGLSKIGWKRIGAVIHVSQSGSCIEFITLN